LPPKLARAAAGRNGRNGSCRRSCSFARQSLPIAP